MTEGAAGPAGIEARRTRIVLTAWLAIAATALVYVAVIVDRHTIAIVQSRHLLPRWDLATHLGHGWEDYHFLVTGQIPRLLRDLWMQGYWPPMLSLVQVPFYVALAGDLTAGLRSALAAFVLTGLTGCTVLWRMWRSGALLPASLFLALLMSSPFLLAYASVTMTETLGALAQLGVLLCYVRYRQRPDAQAARHFAVSLTALFFTKYNYFFLLAVPLVLHEWLERTSGRSPASRAAALLAWIRRLVWSPTGGFVAAYLVLLLAIVSTGGFDLHVFGHRVSVHTIGNSGQLVLYLLIARVWFLHRRGAIDWERMASRDLRIRPLLLWFVVPITIWFASPYPNHIRDFANLVINRPLGEPTVESGVATYLEALRTTYFYSDWVLAFVLVAFVVALARYRRQPPLTQLLVVAIPLQFAAIALHQTRFPRFLLLTVVLLCLAAAAEVGRLISGGSSGRIAASLLAPLLLGAGILAASRVVEQDRFTTVAFEHYTDSEPLRNALLSIRGSLKSNDRLAIVGQGNELSPGLFRLELGPPSGVACSPFELGGAARLDLALATRVLLLEPLDAGSTTLDSTSYYLPQRQAVLARVESGEFTLQREFQLKDMHVALRMYERTSSPSRLAVCQ